MLFMYLFFLLYSFYLYIKFKILLLRFLNGNYNETTTLWLANEMHRGKSRKRKKAKPFVLWKTVLPLNDLLFFCYYLLLSNN